MATRWKLAKGKTWRGKLEESHPNHGKVVAIPQNMRRRFGTGTMLIPRPADVDAVIRRVPAGRLITQSQIRERLAGRSRADCACPLTTGMFIRIAAEAAEEDLERGRRRVTPYWRVVKDDGKLHDKFPGGVGAQASKLRQEGFTITAGRTGRVLRVKDFENHLVKS